MNSPLPLLAWIKVCALVQVMILDRGTTVEGHILSNYCITVF
jgi:hypothetical protein